MKKLLLFMFAIVTFAACEQAPIEEQSAARQDAPKTITVGFEGDDTRIQLNEAQKTVWNADDEVSVFYQSYTNMKWVFQGQDGDRKGLLEAEDSYLGEQVMDDVIIVYPYNSDYRLNLEDKYVLASLPAVQSYKQDSYGEGGNLMVAASKFSTFTLKNVCGWLKVQLTGNGERVTSITLRGNNGEQLAGLAYINATTAKATLPGEVGSYDDNENSVGGGFDFADSIFTEVTLDCGAGVELTSKPTAFYIAVLPQSLKQGFTIDVDCDNGTSTTKSTSNPIIVERNFIKQMESFTYDGVHPEVYELAYTTNDGTPLNPLTTEGFGGEFKENIFDISSSSGKLVFTGNITTIPDQAFGLCENLTWIDLPKGITTIGTSAFSGCISMEEITIPESVTSVGAAAFVNCSGKAHINCNIPDDINYTGCFMNAGWTEVIIDDRVTTIGDMAFKGCKNLTSVTIGDNVTSIPYEAFYECTKLINITLGNNVKSIETYAFCDANFQTIILPDSLTSIAWRAFQSCSNLTSITIPKNVESINDEAFRACFDLSSVYCIAKTPPHCGNEAFSSALNMGSFTIYVPNDSVRQYKITEGWSDYADYIVGYDF